MPTQRFKQILARDEVVRVFSLGRLIHPIVVEMYGLAGGYHGFWIDQEHSGPTVEQVLVAAITARANDMDSFVRLAPTSYSAVSQYLESGVGGVMAAQIQSAAQAEEFVTWAKFAPRGRRGMFTACRDADYTHQPVAQFADRANREHLVAIQIETLGALNDAAAIAAIDGVDLLFVGPSDLSQALGVLGQNSHPKVWEAIDQVAAVCRRHGKNWGVVPADPAFATRAVEKGCRMVTYGHDVLAVRYGIDAIKNAYAGHFPSA